MTSLKLGLLLLLTFLPGPSDQIKKQKLESQGKQRNYYLFVPELASQAKNPALLVLFHGSGRNGLSLVEKWKDLASKEGFIIVGPDSSSSEGWRIPDDGSGIYPRSSRSANQTIQSRPSSSVYVRTFSGRCVWLESGNESASS